MFGTPSCPKVTATADCTNQTRLLTLEANGRRENRRLADLEAARLQGLLASAQLNMAQLQNNKSRLERNVSRVQENHSLSRQAYQAEKLRRTKLQQELEAQRQAAIAASEEFEIRAHAENNQRQALQHKLLLAQRKHEENSGSSRNRLQQKENEAKAWDAQLLAMRANLNSATRKREELEAQKGVSDTQMQQLGTQLRNMTRNRDAHQRERTAAAAAANRALQAVQADHARLQSNRTSALAEKNLQAAQAKATLDGLRMERTQVTSLLETARQGQKQCDEQLARLQHELQQLKASMQAKKAVVKQEEPWRVFARRLHEELKKNSVRQRQNYQEDAWYKDFEARYESKLTNRNSTEIIKHLMKLLGKVYTIVVINRFNPVTNQNSPRNNTAMQVAAVGRQQLALTVKNKETVYNVSEVIDTSQVPLQTRYEKTKANSPLPDMIRLTTEGASAIVFGYGFSGSGKTHSLIGAPDPTPNVGLMQLLLQEVLAVKGTSVNLEHAFELYGVILAPALVEAPGGGRSDWSRAQKFSIPVREPEFDQFVKPQVNKLILGPLRTETDVQALVRGANIALTTRTSRATPNNKHSSRSHAFLVFKVSNGAKTGYITFVDMAGTENSVDTIRNLLRVTKDKIKPDPSDAVLPLVIRAVGPLWQAEEVRRIKTYVNAYRETLRPEQLKLYNQQPDLDRFRFHMYRDWLLAPKGHFLDGEPKRVLVGIGPSRQGFRAKSSVPVSYETYKLEAVDLHEFPDVATTLMEGFFVAQTLVDLQVLLKKRNSGKDANYSKFRPVNKMWPLNDLPYTGSNCTFVDPAQLAEQFRVRAPRLDTLLEGRAILRPKALNESAERSSSQIFDPTRMTSILRSLSEMGSAPDLSFMTMLAVVNPMIPYGAADAAYSTMQFAKSVSA